MRMEIDPYPNTQLLQRAVAFTLARVRAFNAKHAGLEPGPSVMRVTDNELDIDCVVVIGERGSAAEQKRVNDVLEQIALLYLEGATEQPEEGPAWQNVVQ